jgi:histidyl-tRNA synthetase
MTSLLNPFSKPPRFALCYEKDCVNQAHMVASFVRRVGHSATMSMKPSIKQGLAYASREGAEIALIFGRREVEEETVTLKRMADGEQITLTLDAFLGGPLLNPVGLHHEWVDAVRMS